MFDPSLPIENTEIDAVQMRGQLNGLKDLIDAIQSITSAQVDGTNTLNPGDAASVNLSVIGSVLHFSFGIPRGNDGFSGPPITSFIVDGVTTLNPGDNASVQTNFDGASVRFNFGIPRGNDGGIGSQGPPFANAVVDGVSTLNPGDNAQVQTSFDGSNVHFNFGIPRGQNGNDGGPGGQGPPGEVTNAQLSGAISGTSNNSNGVSALNMTVSDPPTQGEMQAIASKLDELISALRR